MNKRIDGQRAHYEARMIELEVSIENKLAEIARLTHGLEAARDELSRIKKEFGK